jgi:hypothetical protein
LGNLLLGILTCPAKVMRNFALSSIEHFMGLCPKSGEKIA